MKIQQDGRMDEWCNDSMEWLSRLSDGEYRFSSSAHGRNHTSHTRYHNVPIVTGERRKQNRSKRRVSVPNERKPNAAWPMLLMMY